MATRLARRFGIARIVALGDLPCLISVPNQTVAGIHAANDYTLTAMDRGAGFCIGFCFLNPAHPVSFLSEEMERCIVEGGMKGIKLWCAVKATDSRVDPIMERAQDLGIPVLHHAWYKNADEYTWEESTPADIANLARRFPHVTIIMAHLGGARHRGLLDLVDVPNVLVDTAGSQPESGLVEYGVRQLGAHRVIYGSDWPIRDYAVQIGRVLGAHLRPEEYELILRDNAQRVLGLGETWA